MLQRQNFKIKLQVCPLLGSASIQTLGFRNLVLGESGW